MSIAQSFENLNRSLRNISDQQRLKQQSEERHEEKMLQLQDQINDPRRKLLRSQARAQLEDVQLMTPYDLSKGSTIDMTLYESKYKGLVQKGIPDDAILNDDGVIVKRGTDGGATNIPYTMPRYLHQVAQNRLYAIKTTGDMETPQFNRKGMAAIKALADYKNSIKTTTPILAQKDNIRKLQIEVDEYNEIKNDPTKMVTMLRSDNEKYNAAIIMNSQRPNPDPKLHTMLSSLRDSNDSRVNALAKSATLKNIKMADFHRGVGKDLIHIKVPYRLGRDPGGKTEVGGEIYKRGRKTMGQDGAGAGKRALKQSRRTQAVRRHTRLQNDINIAKAGLGREDTINALLNEGSAKDEKDAELMYKMLYKATDKFIANKEQQIYNFGLEYKDDTWFWRGRDAAREQFDVIDAAAKGQKPQPKLRPVGKKENPLDLLIK